MTDLTSSSWTNPLLRGGGHADFLRRQGVETNTAEQVMSDLRLSQDDVIVDVGCGEGGFLRSVKKLMPGCVAVGVDLSLDLLKIAERTGESTCYVQGDGGRLPLRSSSVDRVLCQRVLLHLEQPQTVIAEARRVLRSDGLVLFVEPAWSRFEFVSGDAHLDGPMIRHVQDGVRWPAIGESLPRMLSEAGLQVVDATWVVVRRAIDPGRYGRLALEVSEREGLSRGQLDLWISRWTNPDASTVSHVRRVLCRGAT